MACGAVTALRCPYAAGRLADMADVSVDGGADLCANALIGPEKWHIAVSGSAGDDVDKANVIEVAEARDDVSVEVVEVFESPGEETLPESGGLGEVDIA